MQAKATVLPGGTGLIGNHLLQLLLNSGQYNRVRMIVRKSINITHINYINTIATH
jgi:NAD dependent epimerase/dehydratase family enzyme